jgi:hypothetical protein
MKTLTELQTDFSLIGTDEQLNEFAHRYGLSSTGIIQSKNQQVLSTIGATIEGIQVLVEHRWYDPSGPFQNLPDMSKARLELNGIKVQEIAYSD